VLEVVGGPGVDFCEGIGVGSFRLLDFATERFNFDTGAVGESLDGLWKGEAFSHLDEFEDISAGAAGETFEYLLVGVDVEAGPMVFVEGAEADHFPAFLAEADVLGNDIYDVAGLLHPGNCCLVKCSRHRKVKKSKVKM
jgi:hypothetical protein